MLRAERTPSFAQSSDGSFGEASVDVVQRVVVAEFVTTVSHVDEVR